VVREREGQDRFREPTGVAPRCSDGAAMRRFALVAASMATIISPGAKRCSHWTSGLRTIHRLGPPTCCPPSESTHQEYSRTPALELAPSERRPRCLSNQPPAQDDPTRGLRRMRTIRCSPRLSQCFCASRPKFKCRVITEQIRRYWCVLRLTIRLAVRAIVCWRVAG
jgi:hypothetical protein